MPGTVMSDGFPGRIAREVTPNPKCSGCLHYDGQGGRTGVCSIGWPGPWQCGDGGAQDIGYAPVGKGAGSYLPDLSNYDPQAPQAETQFVSKLYGDGQTRPVTFKQQSLGEEEVDFVKSYVVDHVRLQRSMCRLCNSRGLIGASPFNVAPQECTCSDPNVRDVAKALVARLSNRQRSRLTADQVVEFVSEVVGEHSIVKSARSRTYKPLSDMHPHDRHHITNGGAYPYGCASGTTHSHYEYPVDSDGRLTADERRLSPEGRRLTKLHSELQKLQHPHVEDDYKQPTHTTPSRSIMAKAYSTGRAGQIGVTAGSTKHGEYRTSGGRGAHHLDFHPHGGGKPERIGTFGTHNEAMSAAGRHARLTGGPSNAASSGG